METSLARFYSGFASRCTAMRGQIAAVTIPSGPGVQGAAIPSWTAEAEAPLTPPGP